MTKIQNKQQKILIKKIVALINNCSLRLSYNILPYIRQIKSDFYRNHLIFELRKMQDWLAVNYKKTILKLQDFPQ
jgi:hypothetical protein